MKIKQAVILAGGQGTRLRPLTLSTPKPLIRINGVPFLEYLLTLLKENGIKEVVILIGYLGEMVEDYFGDGRKFGLSLKYLYAPVEYESGSRLIKAMHLLDERFLLLYCDNYWPLNLKLLTEFYEEKGKDALVTVYDNQDNYTQNNMLVDKNGLVTIYDKTRTATGLNGVDIGFFIFKKKLFKNLPKENFSFEKVLLQRFVKNRQLVGFLSSHKYYGLSNLERIPVIKKFLSPKKIVILDRDGIINKKPPKGDYVKNWQEFEFLDGAIEGLKLLTKKGYEFYIVTNQAGIARGLMTEAALKKIHRNMLIKFKEKGIKIKQIYYCPHDWDEGCNCRKPKPGMLFKAASEYNFDLTKAIFIGDDIRDRLTAKFAGCTFVMMKQDGNLRECVSKIV
jgi:D-glycero-D-manno-heptose 1,7-bisphosphate phosphatase